MTKHAILIDGGRLPDSKIHLPKDNWSTADKAMLVSALAVGALLVGLGATGLFIQTRRPLGFSAFYKVPRAIYALGASCGGTLLLTAAVLASVKAVLDAQASRKIQKILTGEIVANRVALTPQLEEGYTRGCIGQYHILYYNENVHIFRSKAACDKFVATLNLEENSPEIPTHTATNDSVMDTHLFDTKIQSTGTWPYHRETKAVYVKQPTSLRDQVPKETWRLGLALFSVVASIGMIVTPIFLRFPQSNLVQLAGIGTASVMLYGALAGLLLAKRSDEFAKKGYKLDFRRVSQSESRYLNGVGYGIARAALVALLAGGLMATAGTALPKFSIHPLYVAPIALIGVIALLAYAHFKGRQEERAWREGCSEEMEAYYDHAHYYHPTHLKDTDAHPLDDGDKYQLIDLQRFGGARIGKIESGASGYVIVYDLADIKERKSYEAAKRQYDLSVYFLAILATALVVSLIGARLILWKLPKPI